MLSREWGCSWSSADRRCSNYIWVIDNFITYYGASYIRGFTVDVEVFVMPSLQGCVMPLEDHITFKTTLMGRRVSTVYIFADYADVIETTTSDGTASYTFVSWDLSVMDHMRFEVQADMNALMKFADANSNPVFILGIGWTDNAASLCHGFSDVGPWDCDTDSSDYLSATEYRKFWFWWNTTTVSSLGGILPR